MEAMLPRRFSIFAGSNSTNSRQGVGRELPSPTLICRTDREVYRPGDEVLVTIEIHFPSVVDSAVSNGAVCSFLIKKLSFEIKGMEKLDSQWFATQKPLQESRQRRGEFFFMDSSAPNIASNLIVSSGTTKTYLVRAELPNTLPPSYKGATIRYLYYVKSMLSGQWQIFDKTYAQRGSKDLTEMEARIPLHVWTGQGNSGLLSEEGQLDGIVPATTIQLDTYWKEVDGESDWVRANDVYGSAEEGYDSSKDETSSVSSYNPNKESLLRSFGSSLSLHSTTARSSSRDLVYLEGNRTSLSVTVPPPQLSVAESVSDNNGDTSPQKSPVVSPSQRQRLTKSPSLENDEAVVPPKSGEGFVRGRSYNIRLDEQVLLRFSPKNSESTYYFSDMIGGTLTFFHEGAARRCLEVLVTLETSETINRQFLHPSRRNSPTITKVQSEHHEVVADLVQTSFLFSIPTDGPMSFSTPHISVNWCLRFEFYTTPKNVDWTRYEHPLLVEGRDKNEWVLPITVHAPPSGNHGQSRNKKPLSVEPPWGRT